MTPGAVALLAACSHGPTASPDARARLEGTPLSPALVEESACEGRSQPCRMEGLLNAGTASDGTTLVVATVTVAPREYGLACTPRERWLMRATRESARRQQLLATDCPSSEMALASITMTAPGHLRYYASEDVAYPSEAEEDPNSHTETVELALDPLAIERWTTLQRTPHIPCSGRESTWDWRTFQGETHFVGRCADTAAVVIPLVTVADAAFATRTWETTGLGPCSATIDGSASHGFADPAGPSTASLRVLGMKDVLFVEITDDRFVTSGPLADELEVNMVDPDATRGIPLVHVSMDVSRSGADRNVRVVAPDARTRRIRIEGFYFSVVLRYRDTDDGRSAQTLSSSLGEHEGFMEPIDEASAVCRPDGGALQIERKPLEGRPTVPIVRGQ
jgi:hypothetical protein